MSVKVLIPLGKGFEEIEAISVIDVLRRVGCEVILAAVDAQSQKTLVVESQSGLKVSVNVKITEVLASSLDSIVLPGGWEGTQNLIASKEVGALLANLNQRNRIIGAICAAPLALFKHKILTNQNFTCYPGIEENIANKNYISHQAVVRDKNLITSRGPATALCFGFALAKALVGETKAKEVQRGMLAQMKKTVYAISAIFFTLFLGGCLANYSNIIENHEFIFSKEGLKQQIIEYVKNPQQLLEDIEEFKANFDKVVSFLNLNASKEWGQKNTQLPSQEVYVKYTDSYLSRARVDFNKGLISVETLDTENPKESLKKAIVTTLLTPDDPEKVDLFTDKEVKLKGEPYLQDLVKDNEGKAIKNATQANRFAEYLIANKLKTTEIKEKNIKKQVHYVEFAMSTDYKAKSQNKYGGFVSFYSKAYKLEEALVFAIIQTESAFNPYAVSYVPAYGLMQIVPTSAGRDVYKALNNQDGIPTKEMLFVPKTNIQYGSTYLNILFTRYITGIQNSLSHEYCVIAAYNTGSGNVLNIFDRNRTKAVSKINSMTSAEVYRYLRTNLKYEEARNYLHKVTNAKKTFQK